MVLFRKLLRVHNPPPTLPNDDGCWATSELDKTNIFAKHLTNTFQPHYDILFPNTIKDVENFLNSPLQMSPPLRAFSPGKVEFIINKIPPGLDLITAKIIRHLSYSLPKYKIQ